MFLPNEATTFAAESKAIEFAFEYIKLLKNTIFSDSLSCFNNVNINHSYILNCKKNAIFNYMISGISLRQKIFF